ncbi:Tectonin beta-propeller repeat-containing protein 1 [Sorochytrium milnesiophthora]
MSTRATSSPALAARREPQIEVDDVWENQRGQVDPQPTSLTLSALFGRPKFSPKSLLPTDRGPWSDANGNYKLPKERVQLPDPQQWEWASEWMIDMAGDVDSEGWIYSFNFAGFPWSSDCTAFTYVRRRRWKRMRRLRVAPSRTPNPMPAQRPTVASAPTAAPATLVVPAPNAAQQGNGGAKAQQGSRGSLATAIVGDSGVGLGLASHLARPHGSNECKLTRAIRNHKIRSDAGRVEAARALIVHAFGCRCRCDNMRRLASFPAVLGSSTAALSDTASQSDLHRRSSQVSVESIRTAGSDSDVDVDPTMQQQQQQRLASTGAIIAHCQHDHDNAAQLDREQQDAAEQKAMLELFGTTDSDEMGAKLKDAYEQLDFESSKVILTRILQAHYPQQLQRTLQQVVLTRFVFYSNKKMLVPDLESRTATSEVAQQ